MTTTTRTRTVKREKQPQGVKQPSPLDVNTIAGEAYVYLYPLVLMDITRSQMTNVKQWDGNGPSAPMNTFGHFRAFPLLTFKTVVRANFDTLYTSLWMDLTKEPMILSLPDSGGRYYLMPSLDMWTDVYASPGWRTTGTKAGDFAYCPPGWRGDLPKEVTRIDAPTPIVWFIGRVQTDGKKDYAAVHKFQDGMKLTPLSEWGNSWKASAGEVDPSVDMKTPPLKQIEKMGGKRFFERAARLLKLHAPHVMDFSQVARLKQVGIVPGEELDFKKLGVSVQQALSKAPDAAFKKVEDKTAKLGTASNGWQMTISTMGSYGIAYLQRAAVSLFGLGCNQLDDAIYPTLLTDSGGNPIKEGVDYTTHFDKDDLPPALAFWSLTLYDKDGFPVPNSLDRASLSSWMPLKYNKDGSLDLYFQATSPGKDKEPNWLPTPNKSSWNLCMRLYAPRPQVRDGAWSPPAIRRAGGGADLSGADGLSVHRRE